ncbi:MAG: hypothetical protein AMXMBFR36_10760 [Acidobacteriota bacterium]
MSAHAAVEQLSALLDGELDVGERDAVDRHLSSCPQCRTRLDGLRAAAAALANLGPVAAPRALERGLAHGTRFGFPGKGLGLERRRLPRYAAFDPGWWPALALLALIAGVGALLAPAAPAPLPAERAIATAAALEGAPVAIVGDRIFRRDGTAWREIENGELPAGARDATPEEARAQTGELPGLARLLAGADSVELVRGGERIRIHRR